MPNCDERNNYCAASLGTCIDSGSLVRPDNFDLFREHFGGLIAIDFLFSDGHCSITTNSMKVETKATCEKFLDTLATQLGLSMNLSLEEDQNSRLVINENQITFFDISEHLDDKAFCKFTSRLIARVILEHELMAKLVRIQITIDGVFSLLGQETIQSCLDGCLESSFQPGNVTPSEKESLLNCVNKKYGTSRHRRSTVLEWIFSNGADVDRINNKMVELGDVLN